MKWNPIKVCVLKHLFIGCAYPAPVPKRIYFTILLEYSQKASEYWCWLITFTGNFNYIERKALFRSQNGVEMGGKRGLSHTCGSSAGLLACSAPTTTTAATQHLPQLKHCRCPNCCFCPTANKTVSVLSQLQYLFFCSSLPQRAKWT